MPHLLSVLWLCPLLAALLIRALVIRRPTFASWLSLAATAVVLIAAVPLWSGYNPKDPELQFVERIASSSVGYVVGADGVSVLLILIVAITGVAIALASIGATVSHGAKGCASFLTTEAAILGLLMAHDLVLFCGCWALLLGAVATLGGPPDRRVRRLAVASTIAMAIGAVAAASGALTPVGRMTFDLDVLQTISTPSSWQALGFVAWIVGVVLVVPVFLLSHRADVMSPWSVFSVALLVAAPFSVMRVALPIFPVVSKVASPLVLGVLAIGIVGAAVAAVMQRELDRMSAWLGVSQTAMLVAGLFALTPDALSGAVVHQMGLLLGMTALLLVAGASRRASADAVANRSAWRPTAIAALCLLALIVVVNGVGGFPGPRMLMNGAAERSSLWAVVMACGALCGLAVGVQFMRIGLATRSFAHTRAIGSGVWAGVLMLAAAGLVAMSHARVAEQLNVPALKVASRIDARYTNAFEAACDTTVTDEMKAANPANQFLAAAPCGPNGEPLTGSSVVSPVDTSR
ncbi:MAG: proton-conducting transporter membrane subunit [Vicinamibacterales bacterium]